MTGINRANPRNERDAQDAVRLEASQRGVRLWRNNVGAVTTEDGRHIRYGLANDSSRMNAEVKSADLIGITPVVVTADMVGQTIGVFTSIEVKGPNWTPGQADARTKAQRHWQQLVRALGGIARFSKGKFDDNY